MGLKRWLLRRRARQQIRSADEEAARKERARKAKQDRDQWRERKQYEYGSFWSEYKKTLAMDTRRSRAGWRSTSLPSTPSRRICWGTA